MLNKNEEISKTISLIVPAHRVFFLFLTFISACALIFALAMQYLAHLEPCHLCIMQRWPYALIIAFGFTGTWLSMIRQETLARLLAVLCCSALLGEAGLGFYHTGVEQHWWRSVFEGCTINFDSSQDLLQQIQQRPAARCDEISWSFIGLSMAAWNTILSSALFILSTAYVVFWNDRAQLRQDR